LVTDESLETRVLTVLDRLLTKTRFAKFPLLPSYWLSAGVINWSVGALAAAGFFFLVLLSYVLFFGFLAFQGMGNLFSDAASIAHSRTAVFNRWNWFRFRQETRAFTHPSSRIERLFNCLSWIRPDLRALLVKDVRMFWRDTAQWGQTIMLFGLLGVYILNLRHFSQQLNNPFWIHLISYLNLGACSLNLATLTTRFVYPQFSLEGKRLWIVGMAPLGLPRIIKAKFWLSGCASLIVTLGLISLSCYMLGLPLERTFYFAGAVTVMTFTLTGLALGLGVLYPNFREENPGKIVSGFGGAFCLVLSFLYIFCSVILLAIGSPWTFAAWQSATVLLSGWIGFAVLSLLLGWVPLKLALRRAASFEM
jgi:ABC-2 type transport system permease protein